jgi:cytochrome c biogenesis protein CcmG/thiol:disulfide interchange protein DsbE
MPRRRILVLGVFLLLLGACSSEPPVATVSQGQLAPDFTLTDLQGQSVRLADLRDHRMVALRFWADWCPFCRREMGELEPLYQELRERGLEMVAINVGQDRERVLRFVREAGYTYPTLLDEHSRVAREYGVQAIPMTFLIDPEGRVQGRILGEANPDSLRKMVEPWLLPSTTLPAPGTESSMHTARP